MDLSAATLGEAVFHHIAASIADSSIGLFGIIQATAEATSVLICAAVGAVPVELARNHLEITSMAFCCFLFNDGPLNRPAVTTVTSVFAIGQ